MPKTDSNSTAEKDKPQTPQFFQNAPPYEDETINLYEMWITLWSKKWIVIGVTAVAALGSVVFALLQPPVYKAKVLVLPPKAQDIQSLNVQGGLQGDGVLALQRLSTEDVFATFKNNLSSRNLQKKFIKEYGLMEVL
ncbi:MAG: Wzz/FepE/Etk N-terminal domain-containing protein, partial [SAR324 cluster bacterium]|nr:Wzz/FepE/Etk N-terminal domain-containing protein [SAR324 cluster bacterium]